MVEEVLEVLDSNLLDQLNIPNLHSWYRERVHAEESNKIIQLKNAFKMAHK